jgi:hypothetical protein
MQSISPYRLDSELGHGALGVVFRGFDPVIGRAVAISIIRMDQFPTADEKAELRLRFVREATAPGQAFAPEYRDRVSSWRAERSAILGPGMEWRRTL